MSLSRSCFRFFSLNDLISNFCRLFCKIHICHNWTAGASLYFRNYKTNLNVLNRDICLLHLDSSAHLETKYSDHTHTLQWVWLHCSDVWQVLVFGIRLETLTYWLEHNVSQYNRAEQDTTDPLHQVVTIPVTMQTAGCVRGDRTVPVISLLSRRGEMILSHLSVCWQDCAKSTNSQVVTTLTWRFRRKCWKCLLNLMLKGWLWPRLWSFLQLSVKTIMFFLVCVWLFCKIFYWNFYKVGVADYLLKLTRHSISTIATTQLSLLDKYCAKFYQIVAESKLQDAL